MIELSWCDSSAQDNPVKFTKLYTTSPREGLEKAEEVIQMYKNLVTKSDKPVRWNCEDEFAEDYPESSTAVLTQTPGNMTEIHVI